ncbi:MAG: DUF1080 domain-containing protein [Ginsengibacter sp.]
MKKSILPSILLLPASMLLCSLLPAQMKIFTPDNKSEWNTYLSKTGKNDDPQKVFQFEENVLHVSGEDVGYMATKKKYGSFHFTVEFKWGEKRYPPREKEKRDAGILYHTDFYSGDKIWPRSLEYQIQEGDCGDFWMTDSTTIINNDTLTQPKNWLRVVKLKDAEKPKGEWNKAEVIVQDGNITQILNGETVNTGRLGNTKDGYILLQSEYAEIYYRNMEIKELK